MQCFLLRGSNLNSLKLIKRQILFLNLILQTSRQFTSKISIEVKELDTKEINKNTTNITLKSLLKGAFICFLRLDCPIDNIIWQTQKVKSRLVEGRIIEAKTLLECHSYFSTKCFGKFILSIEKFKRRKQMKAPLSRDFKVILLTFL